MTPVGIYDEAHKMWKERIAELERGNRDLRKQVKTAEAERDAAVAKVKKLTQLVDDLYQDRARL